MEHELGLARLSVMLVLNLLMETAVQVKEPHAYYQDPAAQAAQAAALVSSMELQPTDAQPEVCIAAARPP
jgi:hypothetical protein